MKCGICLPECPTYRLENNENESPRGRLALIEGMVAGKLAPDAGWIAHIDRCLGCRRCERICPSQVQYGRAIDLVRALTSGKASKPVRMPGPRLLRLSAQIARQLPTGLSSPFGRLHHMHGIAATWPMQAPGPKPGDYPARTAAHNGRVALFSGCTGDALQGDVLNSAIRLLNRVGYSVRVPQTTHCCGALAAHSGRHREAEALADSLRGAFGGDIDMLVSIASGCGTQLDEYVPPLPLPHKDICRFLLHHGDLDETDFTALPAQVLLHTPCSVENLYRGADWTAQLLQLIPGIDLLDIGEKGQCCGAAGDYLLRYPDTAERLRQPLVDQATQSDATKLVSSNIGCAMHLAAGLKADAGRIEVLHPVQLLAGQLRDV